MRCKVRKGELEGRGHEAKEGKGQRRYKEDRKKGKEQEEGEKGKRKRRTRVKEDKRLRARCVEG